MFLEPELLEKKYPEPEPPGKKLGAGAIWKKKSGAGATKKLSVSPALNKIMHKQVCLYFCVHDIHNLFI